jgi:CRP-like cAMP-binding protein
MAVKPGLNDRPFLSLFGVEQQQRLRTLAEEVTFEEGDVILVAGERAEYFYLLLSGSVAVDVVAQSYTVRVQALAAGEAFGWSSLLEGCDSLFQVRARERCTVLRFHGEKVIELCRQDPTFGVEFLRGVLRTVAGRVYGAETKLAELCGVAAPAPNVPGRGRHRPRSVV